MSATEDVVIVLPVVPSLTYDRGVPASLPWVRPGGLQAEPWGHLWWLQEPVGFLEPLPENVHWDPRLPASRAHEAAGEEGQADSKLESDSVGITGSLREQDLPSQVSEVTGDSRTRVVRGRWDCPKDVCSAWPQGQQRGRGKALHLFM